MRIQSATDEDSAVAPLTSGNWSLDQALEIHLKTCCVLLQVDCFCELCPHWSDEWPYLTSPTSPQMLAETDFSPSRKELLQEVSLQAEVLQKISCILLEEDRGVSAGDSEWTPVCVGL